MPFLQPAQHIPSCIGMSVGWEVFYCPCRTGIFLLTTKETKLPAENFCFEASGFASNVRPQKFVRPGSC